MKVCGNWTAGTIHWTAGDRFESSAEYFIKAAKEKKTSCGKITPFWLLVICHIAMEPAIVASRITRETDIATLSFSNSLCS